MQNVALERAGSVAQVDHRSHQRRGIEQEATVHGAERDGDGAPRRASGDAGRPAYEPVTMVGQHNAGVIERGACASISSAGPNGCAMRAAHSGRLHALAATLSGAVDRDRRDAAEAQRQEQLAAERAREQAQERQQVQEREKVVDKFRTIAGKREAGAQGYGDHNSDWKATPEALRKAVDAYNGANQHTKDLYIEQIQREPQMARAVGQLLHERELVLQRDRGMSL
jgi:hypothetical protein